LVTTLPALHDDEVDEDDDEDDDEMQMKLL